LAVIQLLKLTSLRGHPLCLCLLKEIFLELMVHCDETAASKETLLQQLVRFPTKQCEVPTEEELEEEKMDLSCCESVSTQWEIVQTGRDDLRRDWGWMENGDPEHGSDGNVSIGITCERERRRKRERESEREREYRNLSSSSSHSASFKSTVAGWEVRKKKARK
jgi:hypothetical protein